MEFAWAWPEGTHAIEARTMINTNRRIVFMAVLVNILSSRELFPLDDHGWHADGGGIVGYVPHNTGSRSNY